MIVNGPPGKHIPSSFSPNQKLLAASTMDSVGTALVIWDIEKGTKIQTLPKLNNAITKVEFSQDSKKVIALSRDGEAVIWAVKSGKELKRIPTAKATLQELLKLH